MGRLVTRREAAEELGYTLRSLESLMVRQPSRWPAPVRRELDDSPRGWHYLYDLDALREARGVTSRGDTKRISGIGDEDEQITCNECHRRFRSLPRHLAAVHGLTGAQYRERHGIGPSVPLVGEAAREAMADSNRARDLSHLSTYQTREHLDAARESAITAHRATISRSLTRERLKPAQSKGAPAMRAANRARSEQIAREHGWKSLREAIETTRHLTIAEAARRIGVSGQTVTRRRAEWS